MTLAFDVAATFTAPGAEPFAVDAALTVETGETLVVLGPSGSGKTLLLELVAGFHPATGRVELDGRDVIDAPPERREFGFVFQDYALFPHMTVRENVAFGARYRDDPRDPDELLARLGVSHLVDRTPETLSGGESQRVALARALAVRPEVLLLDEPLSALDAPTRERLRDDLADVLADVTALHVTHDRTTARALADRVAVMADGNVLQVDTPEAVFERPRDPFVARFTGANCLPGALAPDLDCDEFAIRPEHVRLDGAADAGRARVTRAVDEGGSTRISLDLDGTPVTAYATDPPTTGSTVGVSFPAEHRVPFGEGNDDRLLARARDSGRDYRQQ
ncbi:ABC transporter ATP-binding protein [Halomarina pelagica]|uniref:ABC transporter ATP-binding protein n=1 Tax=Halomarina pelagica TaxID=2961599 RepID=UPI0020C40951|nr:ABC transporter ATP-binding protein [Halomarina sp. BND7]